MSRGESRYSNGCCSDCVFFRARSFCVGPILVGETCKNKPMNRRIPQQNQNFEQQTKKKSSQQQTASMTSTITSESKSKSPPSLVNETLSPDVIYYMSQFLTPFETVYVLARVCQFWRQSILQQRKLLFPGHSQALWFRTTILDYIQECRHDFHPNAAPLNHHYDNLLFRYIIDQTAVQDQEKHIDTLLKERKIRLKQLQRQSSSVAASGRRIDHVLQHGPNTLSSSQAIISSSGSNSSSSSSSSGEKGSSQKLSLFVQMQSVVPMVMKQLWNISRGIIRSMLFMPTKTVFDMVSEHVMSVLGTFSSRDVLERNKQLLASNEVKSIKLCICGDENIGKTSLFNRFCHNRFIDRVSHGASSCVYNVYCKYSKFENKANLEVWNTSGVESFRRPLLVNMGHSNCILLCFDITNRKSFENVDRVWLKNARLLLNCNPFVEYVLVGLKGDLDSERKVSHNEAVQYAATKLSAPYIEVSSLHDLDTNQCTFVSVLFAYIITTVFFRMKVMRV